MTLKAFVTGWPISHSKSPALHSFWLKKHAIQGTYKAIAVEADKFEDFLLTLQADGYVGGNVTIPHKEVAFKIIDNLDAAASAIGAVNTIWFERGEICGGNTDAYGFAANLDQHAPQWRKGNNALVLGAGGASRAVVFALLEAGFKNIKIANRTLVRAQNLARHFGNNCRALQLDQVPAALGDMDFLVNTTSIGMSGANDDSLPPLDALPKSAVVTDIVYTPLETPFLRAAKDLGLVTVDGLGMLLHQAVPGFEKWFGTRPYVDQELRNHILGVQ